VLRRLARKSTHAVSMARDHSPPPTAHCAPAIAEAREEAAIRTNGQGGPDESDALADETWQDESPAAIPGETSEAEAGSAPPGNPDSDPKQKNGSRGSVWPGAALGLVGCVCAAATIAVGLHLPASSSRK
jgi:hypothetical protein